MCFGEEGLCLSFFFLAYLTAIGISSFSEKLFYFFKRTHSLVMRMRDYASLR